MKLFLKSFQIGVFLSFLLTATSIAAEDDSVNIQIRNLINLGKYQEAYEILRPLTENDPTNVTLGLFQTEIWIGIGESLYQRKQYKSAFPYFSKAFDAWPSHPLLRSRYEELKDKSLKDHAQQTFAGKSVDRKFTESNKTIFIFDPSLQEASVRLKYEYDELFKSLEEAKRQVNTHNEISTSGNTDLKYIWYSIIALALLTLFNTYILIRKR